MQQPAKDSTVDQIMRWYGKKYTPTEIEQVQLIISLYKEFFSQDIPETFRDMISKDLAKNSDRKQISRESCLLHYWEHQIGGTLHHEIKDIIAEICVYQTQRVHNNQGYLDDPRHLFLHELKLALIGISNKQDLNQAKKLACRWLKFIEKLWFADKFVPGDNDQTMKSTLLKVIVSLEDNIIPTIEFEIENSSALENVTVLGKNLKIFFEHAIRFLLMAYSDAAKPPLNITIGQIINPTYEEMRNIISTQSACFLRALTALHKSLLALDAAEDKTRVDVDDESHKQAFQLLQSSFDTSECKDILLSTKIKNTGIDFHFKTLDCINKYMRGCLLIQELSKYYHLFLLVKKCAKDGGDLLVYGFSGAELNNDIIGCATLVNTLKDCLDAIHRDGRNRWAQISGKTKDSEMIWKLNFDQACIYYNDLTQSRDDCLATLDSLSKAARSKQPSECLENAKRSHERYLEYHKEFNKYRANKIAQSDNAPNTQFIKGFSNAVRKIANGTSTSSFSLQSEVDLPLGPDRPASGSRAHAQSSAAIESAPASVVATISSPQPSASQRLSESSFIELISSNPENELKDLITSCEKNTQDSIEMARSICSRYKANTDLLLRCLLAFYKRQQFKLAWILLQEKLLKDEYKKDSPLFYGRILIYAAIVCYEISKSLTDITSATKHYKTQLLVSAKKYIEEAAENEIIDIESRQIATLKSQINLEISNNPDAEIQHKAIMSSP